MTVANPKETASMLIKFLNLQAGTAFRTGNEANLSVVESAIERAEDLNQLKDHIRDYAFKMEGAEKSIVECFSTFVPRKAAEQPSAGLEVKATEESVGSAMGILEKVVLELLAKTSADKIETEVVSKAEDKIRDFIKAEYGTIERKIVTVIDGQPKKVEGVQHEKFETVLKYVANDLPVFLVGPAGSGKNVLCEQIATALGLEFYFTNAVQQKYELTGFTDAMGNYQETQFYKAFKNGGLFMLDEMDASIPEALITLNMALANRWFDFPAPIGKVKAHPNFRVIAAGNTFGQGASYEYVGRNQLDAASLNRFPVVKIGYSETIENSVAYGDLDLANFCREFRAIAYKTGQQVIVSYRNIGMIAKMSQLLSLEEVLDNCLVKGMEKDDLNIIINDLEDSKYKKALKNIARRMA